MLSATFIDRPRLSLVISIVITLAGVIAMHALPVAQFPDIVPPQVQVTAATRAPGPPWSSRPWRSRSSRRSWAPTGRST